jgi:hypothetical protein
VAKTIALQRASPASWQAHNATWRGAPIASATLVDVLAMWGAPGLPRGAASGDATAAASRAAAAAGARGKGTGAAKKTGKGKGKGEDVAGVGEAPAHAGAKLGGGSGQGDEAAGAGRPNFLHAACHLAHSMAEATAHAQAAALVVLHRALVYWPPSHPGHPGDLALRDSAGQYLTRLLDQDPHSYRHLSQLLGVHAKHPSPAVSAALRRAKAEGRTWPQLTAAAVAAANVAAEASQAAAGLGGPLGMALAIVQALGRGKREGVCPLDAGLAGHSTDPGVQLLLVRQLFMKEGADAAGQGWAFGETDDPAGRWWRLGPVAAAAGQLLALAGSDEGRAAALLGVALSLQEEALLAGPGAAQRLTWKLRAVANAELLRQGPHAPRAEEAPAGVARQEQEVRARAGWVGRGGGGGRKGGGEVRDGAVRQQPLPFPCECTACARHCPSNTHSRTCAPGQPRAWASTGGQVVQGSQERAGPGSQEKGEGATCLEDDSRGAGRPAAAAVEAAEHGGDEATAAAGAAGAVATAAAGGGEEEHGPAAGISVRSSDAAVRPVTSDQGHRPYRFTQPLKPS